MVAKKPWCRKCVRIFWNTEVMGWTPQKTVTGHIWIFSREKVHLVQGKFFITQLLLYKNCAVKQIRKVKRVHSSNISALWSGTLGSHPKWSIFFSVVARYHIEGTVALFSRTMPYTNKQYVFLLQHYFEMKSLYVVRVWSPDLIPLDSFLRGYLKNSVCETSPASLNELKDRITVQIAKIFQTMLKCVFVNLVKRIYLCRSVNSGHFQHLL